MDNVMGAVSSVLGPYNFSRIFTLFNLEEGIRITSAITFPIIKKRICSQIGCRKSFSISMTEEVFKSGLCFEIDRQFKIQVIQSSSFSWLRATNRDGLPFKQYLKRVSQLN